MDDDSRTQIRRRTFMGGAAAAGLAGAGVAAGPAGAAMAAPSRSGRLDEVEHVVILMQENRSFDHYYGTMRGVRGLADRTALRLPSNRSVFHQPDPLRVDGGYLLPFHVDTKKVDGQDLGDLDHSWDGTHLAWDNGNNDGWVPVKTELTMSYFTRSDVPFHRALASAFTICDAYHCSIQGPTTPNRLFLWSGMIDPTGEQGGPAISNPDDYNPVYRWTTYPERLQKAGISWQVYANNEVGDDGSHPFVGDYGDNPLWLFQAYHDSQNSWTAAGRDLALRGGLNDGWLPDSGQGLDTKHVLADFLTAVKTRTLPSVSYVVAPYGYSEHPAARPVDGAAYTQTVLEALWADRELWEKTVVLIDYDENDGFFDHVTPPVAPPGTPLEYVSGRPVGLGPRVPMTVISPWSRGGFVNSQVFDHTSVIRFLEAWTGVHEPNISPWRRAICGDLTSCFDFRRPDRTIPLLPDTAALRRKADQTQTSLPAPTPPAVGAQQLPAQEPGHAPARALPYQPTADLSVSTRGVEFALANHGSATLQLSVYARTALALTSERHDLAAGATTTGFLPWTQTGPSYDVAVHGPNGFLRRALGTATSGPEVTLSLAGSSAHPTLKLALHNPGSSPVVVSVDGVGRHGQSVSLKPGARTGIDLDPFQGDYGWYDVTVKVNNDATFSRQFAGHLENGKPSITG
jgi:phospholipase C